ncbi:hypothetical protein Ndes2526B_g06260 [Nannochloris sp. 'desiccata']|nr:putative Cytohesin-1 [Chlorella desiccata (nom. nud.)]
MPLPTDLQCLWANPDQAGTLKKHAHGRVGGWQERFFVLKGSILYYFKNRKNVKALHGIIPLERARVQSGPPPGYLGNSAQTIYSLCITIIFHVQHAYIAKYPFYVLLAPTPEVHKAWMEALNCASIPRASLLAKLTETGSMSSVFATCTEETKICFPTTTAAVISSSECLRLDPHQNQEAVPGDGAVVVATDGLSQTNGAGKNTAVSPQTRRNVDVTAASSVYTTPTDRINSRSSTPLASKVMTAGATTPEGKNALSARSSAQHAQQEQNESPSLRNTFGVLTACSPEISTAAA